MNNGPRQTASELIYAVGDVHGRYDLLQALVQQIIGDWRIRAPDRRPLVIFCGDYVDRGPQSAEVIEALIRLQGRADIQVRCLKGNHEQGFQRFIDDPTDCARWLRFGGVETLASYGVAAPAPEDRADCLRARDRLLERMPASHLRFLDDLELLLEVGDYAFVHAGVRPGGDLGSQSEQDMLWIRHEFLQHEEPFEKVIVHGHTWVDAQPQLLAHRIGIDTGAYATGVLTAARLDGDSIEMIQARIDDPITRPA